MGQQTLRGLVRFGPVPEPVNAPPTDVVADVGAGTGYFTMRISRVVPQGTVYAVDLQPDMLAIIEQHKRQLKANNVITVQGTETDPRLPAQAVDVALLVDAYHEFAYPREMMENIVKSLKPGGRVIQIEYRGEDTSVPIKSLHKLTVAQAPDGSLYIGESQKGKIWRVIYRGK